MKYFHEILGSGLSLKKSALHLWLRGTPKMNQVQQAFIGLNTFLTNRDNLLNVKKFSNQKKQQIFLIQSFVLENNRKLVNLFDKFV